MKIDALLLEDIENASHPSHFEMGEDYAVLILRLPEMTERGLDIVSYAFVVENGLCYRFDRKAKRLETSGTLEDMYEFLDTKTERLIKDMQRYHFEIEQLEETLYDGSLPKDFMARWIAYKKDVSLIHRLMFHASLAFELFVRYHKKQEGFQALAFADLMEHMGRIRDLAKAAMDKLDNLYDFYRAKVDERMNRNMYWLTIISAIFLPLTLVTGFFGMNTGGLPYTDDPHGTVKVVIISLLLEVLFLIPFILMNMQKTRKFRLRFKKHSE
ncbi:CorA family divalent cation transporter [Hydrogenimonas urashimensis]|uniref:CorA family divalent cation transporter n=1 Tax=Hydrogenimonas urashimensis TaxID=2740515 RepID=UPI00191570BE|nr:CorA family divalent cation transporter [Hydrogenimonas urashimensis]